MQKAKSPETGYRQYLNSLIEDDMRYENLERWLWRFLVFFITAFIVWAIYILHIILDYRLTITLR